MRSQQDLRLSLLCTALLAAMAVPAVAQDKGQSEATGKTTTLDKVTERFLGKRQIGTTGRGIGPAYADKINRIGIRVQDLFDENILRQKVEAALFGKNHLLVKVYNRRAITVNEIVDALLVHAERLRPMVGDTSLELYDALNAGRNVVFEGGQATMLDVDHGTYPYVTSSSSTAGGASTGAGVGPTQINRISSMRQISGYLPI